MAGTVLMRPGFRDHLGIGFRINHTHHRIKLVYLSVCVGGGGEPDKKFKGG